MRFSLLKLTVPQLESLAASQGLPDVASRMELGSMPPPFVAARSLRLRGQDHGEPWATSFLIVRNADQRIIGGCGFKSIPVDGRVDIGYAVAPAAQGQGAATGALKLLCAMAREAGANTVLAEILPDNFASIKVAQKCGFIAVSSRLDADGDFVVQWLFTPK